MLWNYLTFSFTIRMSLGRELGSKEGAVALHRIDFILDSKNDI